MHVKVKTASPHPRFRIGDLARRAQTTPRTIRYYEQMGLLRPPRREGGGFRSYGEHDLERLQKIDALKGLGLSLLEVGEVIDLYFAEGMHVTAKERVVSILLRHRAEADEKIGALEKFRADLDRSIARMRQLIAQARAGHRT